MAQDLAERVARAIAVKFPDAVLNLDPVQGTDRLTGWVIWSGFDELDQIERQKLLRGALSTLEPQDQLLLGPILTLTPSEASDDDEEAA